MKYKDFKVMSQSEMKKVKGGSEQLCTVICQGDPSSMHNCGPEQNEQCYFPIVGYWTSCDIAPEILCGTRVLLSCSCGS